MPSASAATIPKKMRKRIRPSSERMRTLNLRPREKVSCGSITSTPPVTRPVKRSDAAIPRPMRNEDRESMAKDHGPRIERVERGLVEAVASRHGVAIVCIYTTRKAEAADFVETVQGTFGLAAAADSILVAAEDGARPTPPSWLPGGISRSRSWPSRCAECTTSGTDYGDASEPALSCRSSNCSRAR